VREGRGENGEKGENVKMMNRKLILNCILLYQLII